MKSNWLDFIFIKIYHSSEICVAAIVAGGKLCRKQISNEFNLLDSIIPQLRNLCCRYSGRRQIVPKTNFQ